MELLTFLKDAGETWGKLHLEYDNKDEVLLRYLWFEHPNNPSVYLLSSVLSVFKWVVDVNDEQCDIEIGFTSFLVILNTSLSYS